VSELIVKAGSLTPLYFTALAKKNPVPLIVTLLPIDPPGGLKLVIVGA
jgi:hypothetical protein